MGKESEYYAASIELPPYISNSSSDLSPFVFCFDLFDLFNLIVFYLLAKVSLSPYDCSVNFLVSYYCSPTYLFLAFRLPVRPTNICLFSLSRIKQLGRLDLCCHWGAHIVKNGLINPWFCSICLLKIFPNSFNCCNSFISETASFCVIRCPSVDW